MTYSDIYTKFLIEYDKQNITSSYPSLTVYEIATLLDKAYLALIAQKLTGNNPRRAPFEIDIKAIEDLRPLIKTEGISKARNIDNKYQTIKNVLCYDLSDIEKFLYYVSSFIEFLPGVDLNDDGAEDAQDYLKLMEVFAKGNLATPQEIQQADVNGDNQVDTQDLLKFWDMQRNKGTVDIEPITLINHQQSQRFMKSSVNIPWIKTPVAFLEDGLLYVLIDPFKYKAISKVYNLLELTYIKRPESFIIDDDKFNYTQDFELNDSMAEELINLAIVMALETVESPRIQMKENTRALES